MQTLSPTVSLLNWAQAREKVHKVNPELAAIIDVISPSDDFTLLSCTYQYGDLILDKQRFSLSGAAQTKTAEIMRAHGLAYQQPMPAGMVVSGSLELLQSFDDRLVPFDLYHAGDLFGLGQALGQTEQYQTLASWQLTAGARSLFMLPKITDAIANKRLERVFHYRGLNPKQLPMQWELFKRLSQHENFPVTWQAEVLYFNQSWFSHLEDPIFLPLYHYFLRQSWRASQYWRHKYIWDMTFSRIQQKRNLKPNPYLADTVKHLLAIGMGAIPGFKIATDDSLAPVSGLQKIYRDIYGLKQYVPLMVQPSFFNVHDVVQPVYYSLGLPTALEFSPKSRALTSTMSDLHESKHLMTVVHDAMRYDDLGIAQTPMGEFAHAVAFEFYHSETDRYQEIQNTTGLPSTDASMQAQLDSDATRVFSENSPLLRGCIQISRAK